eukprot:TRINITY_DN71065_c0_g1_i1.p1 TRINITY_DN71065_c0_g1~~TRINITY_DN71065_c0_g1_i1.p1  ORF type:complete len:300 (-),score=44.67 TRINITY_DN71065_c0_g1_i1:120-932(-)
MADDFREIRDRELDMEDTGLLQDFESDLDSFYSSGAVDLEPLPASMTSALQETAPLVSGSSQATGSSAPSSSGASSLAAAAGAAAGAIIGKAAMADAVEGLAQAASPSAISLSSARESAGAILQKAKPWREFLMPLSLPKATDACSRLTANMYCFQSNYAILFVLYLVIAVVLHPSALISLVLTAVIWLLFLRKNEDPDWKPKLGGMELGPMQRWLGLLGVTVLVLFVMAGGTILNSALGYVTLAIGHGLLHDPAQTMDGSAGGPDPVPL